MTKLKYSIFLVIIFLCISFAITGCEEEIDESAEIKLCGPDITDTLVNHFNLFISQDSGNLSWFWPYGAENLSFYARRNGDAIESTLQNITLCPAHDDCRGTVTVCNKCISIYHIDHLLIMAYIAESYGTEIARTAGQYQENFWLALITGGKIMDGSCSSRADLAINEIGINISGKMKHADDNNGTTDNLTKSEMCDSFERADMNKICKKPSRTGSKEYRNCNACPHELGPVSGLILPTIDI
ncbi:hypothetical protein KY317_02030 [Candidatus Woesearchaeota archaeon]|nr:hypothetical protein [Candidatus Woesearchaeota archaeon]